MIINNQSIIIFLNTYIRIYIISVVEFEFKFKMKNSFAFLEVKKAFFLFRIKGCFLKCFKLSNNYITQKKTQL